MRFFLLNSWNVEYLQNHRRGNTSSPRQRSSQNRNHHQGEDFRIKCPPYSPDLAPSDYFLVYTLNSGVLDNDLRILRPPLWIDLIPREGGAADEKLVQRYKNL